MTNPTKVPAISEVRKLARGRWPHILRSLAPELRPAIARIGRHVECPGHQGSNGDGFRLFEDAADTGGGICNTCGAFHDGFALLMWRNGWTFRQAVIEVAGVIGVGRREIRELPPSAGPALADFARRQRSIDRVWAESVSPHDALAEPLQRYLDDRGLDAVFLDPEVVRFHPELDYWHQGSNAEPERIGAFPAMLARLSDRAGNPVTLHRTYLTRSGEKAPVTKPKKLMSYDESRFTLSGGAIRLFDAGPRLCVTEGIETALAVHAATGLPVWPCYSATMLEKFEPPAAAGQMFIFADRDRSGRGVEAAKVLKERLWGGNRRVAVYLPAGVIHPDEKCLDFADLWFRSGIEEFPSRFRRARGAA